MKNISIGYIELQIDPQIRLEIITFLKNCFTTINFHEQPVSNNISLKELLKQVDILISNKTVELDENLLNHSFLFTNLPALQDNLKIKNKLLEYNTYLIFPRNRKDLIDILHQHFGKVWFVGAGAGNKELITVKGRKRVANSDVIISDYLLDQNILKDYTNKNTQIISLTKYGNRTKKNKVSQEEINEAILRYSLMNKRVVRLKGGDPFVFGRGGEECEYLLPFHIEYEVVPGVSAMLSALSYAGIPLTHRDYNSGFLVITGYKRECEETSECLNRIGENINYALENRLVALLFMSLNNWNNFSHLIRDKESPLALIEWGAYPRQRVITTTVKNTQEVISKENFKSPTLIAIGENIRTRDHLKWFESLPLSGVRIIIFASELISSELNETLSASGSDCKTYELYNLIPKDIHETSKYLFSLSEYDYIVITSRNAFAILIEQMKILKIDIRKLPNIIVTGKKTEEEFKAIGIYPDIVPQNYSTDGIIESLSQKVISDKRFLFPKSSLSRGGISKYIAEQGGIIDEFILYNNVPKEISKETILEIQSFKAEYIIFTSSSSVDYFFQNINPQKSTFKSVSMGLQTTKSLKEKGIEDIIQPEIFTSEGIHEAIIKNHNKISLK